MNVIEIRRAFFSAARGVSCNARGKKACVTSDMISHQRKSDVQKVKEAFTTKRTNNIILRKKKGAE
jgi:hypothetical protein